MQSKGRFASAFSCCLNSLSEIFRSLLICRPSLHLHSKNPWVNLHPWPKDLAGTEQENTHQRVQVGRGNPVSLLLSIKAIVMLCRMRELNYMSQVSGKVGAVCSQGTSSLLEGYSIWAEHLQQWHLLLLQLRNQTTWYQTPLVQGLLTLTVASFIPGGEVLTSFFFPHPALFSHSLH